LSTTWLLKNPSESPTNVFRHFSDQVVLNNDEKKIAILYYVIFLISRKPMNEESHIGEFLDDTTVMDPLCAVHKTSSSNSTSDGRDCGNDTSNMVMRYDDDSNFSPPSSPSRISTPVCDSLQQDDDFQATINLHETLQDGEDSARLSSDFGPFSGNLSELL
jgi:hypothetical protein